MKCPYCRKWIESTTWRALRPYKRRDAVVISNIDCIAEVGDKFAFIVEEITSKRHIIRGYQLVFLKKLST